MREKGAPFPLAAPSKKKPQAFFQVFSFAELQTGVVACELNSENIERPPFRGAVSVDIRNAGGPVWIAHRCPGKGLSSDGAAAEGACLSPKKAARKGKLKKEAWPLHQLWQSESGGPLGPLSARTHCRWLFVLGLSDLCGGAICAFSGSGRGHSATSCWSDSPPKTPPSPRQLDYSMQLSPGRADPL